MTYSLPTNVSETLHDAVPFVVITALWVVIMLVFYGVFLGTKPPVISYDAWVHASVFIVPGIGFIGHILHQALKG